MELKQVLIDTLPSRTEFQIRKNGACWMIMVRGHGMYSCRMAELTATKGKNLQYIWRMFYSGRMVYVPK